MPLNIPSSAVEVDARSKADVQRELQQSNPFLKNSWLGAIITAAAFRIFDFYLQLKAALRENFPDTATAEFLTRWAAIWGKDILAATRANGNVVATGDVGSVVNEGTILTVSGVGSFISTSEVTVTERSIGIDNLAPVGFIITAITVSDHGLANGVEVTISGAADPEYNITAPVIVIAANEFQYEIMGTVSAENTPGILAGFITATVPVESEDFGVSLNQDAGVQMTPQSPILNVDDVMVVDFGAIGGGVDQETDDSFRLRMLDRIQNPVAHFNVSDVTEKAKEIAGVTRVFVQEITPVVGQVTVYFMRDNDSNPIPANSEVIKVRDKLLTIKPVNTADEDVIVVAPTAVTVSFMFDALTPNTSTMQDAIIANLRQFFDERTTVGVNIDEDAYRSAIFNTVDTVTGDVVSTFILDAPFGDIVINDGQIGVLGTVTFV